MHGNSFQRKLSIVKNGGSPIVDVRLLSMPSVKLFCHFDIELSLCFLNSISSYHTALRLTFSVDVLSTRQPDGILRNTSNLQFLFDHLYMRCNYLY